MAKSNPTFNTPDDAERQRMSRDHHIGWHPAGGWCRKFPGDKNRTYFGKVSTADAIRAHNAEEDRRSRGDAPAIAPAALSVERAVAMFLVHMDRESASGAIGPSQRAHYGYETGFLLTATDPGGELIVGPYARLGDFCQLDAPDVLFRPLRAAAITRGMSAASKFIVQVRTFLDWCSNVRRFIPAPFYADAFSVPSDKERRAARGGVRREAYWEPAEVRQIIAAAKASGVHRHAHVLLMLNGGMGATDISNLLDGEVDWQRACIDTDRSKTLVRRIVPLWDETVAAMKASRAARVAPVDPNWDNRFFLTRRGKPLVVEKLIDGKMKRTDSVRTWMYQLLNKPETVRKSSVVRLPHLKRRGAGAYTFRSIFLTLARGGDADPNLDAIIAGHKLPRAILEGYLRGNLLEKLKVVTTHVHSQIFDSA